VAARGFSIATKCSTIEELIEKFRDRVDEGSILVNAVEAREVGTECAFAILLADKKVALAGTCVVQDVYIDANNPFMRPGMRLAIKRLGPESQKVFAQLLAKRIAPRRMTQALPVVTVARTTTDTMKPVVVMPRGSKTEVPRTKPAADVLVPRTNTSTLGSRSGVPHTVQQRATQPIRGRRSESPALEVDGEAPRRMSTVQIPPREQPDEPLLRAPRATPFELETIATAEAKIAEARAAAKEAQARLVAKQAEAQLERPKQAPRIEQRAPGSPYILPANPLTNVSDASLEGLVDCRLFEAKGALASPEEFPFGTQDDDDDEPAVIRDSVRREKLGAPNGIVRTVLERQRSEPMPLPPPPARVADPTGLDDEPQRLTPRSYAESKLPDLNIPGANDRARVPRVPRTVRKRLLLAVLLLPMLGAAAVVLYMTLVAMPAPTSASIGVQAVASLYEPEQAIARVEPAPPEPPPEPLVADAVVPPKPQPIHAVLVKTYPIAAKVTVGNRSFGTTPTYIKIPANTPIKVRMERPGFKPVVYPFVSKRPFGKVFVKLQRRGAR
jgi:hypothetical protein